MIGPRTPAELDDYLATLQLDLPAESLTELDAVSAPAPGYPETAQSTNADAVRGGVSAHSGRLRPVA